MPPITNGDRPSARPSTRKAAASSASATHRPRTAKVTAGATPATPAKTPTKGKVVRRADPATNRAAAAAAAGGEESAPANMRALPRRNITAVCDAVSVASRFPSQSRCSAVAPDATVWTGEADGSIVIRLAPSGLEVHRLSPIGRSVVLTLANVSGRMWAGYSDGALRVFDPATQAVVGESTQHTAAVYAMCAADGFVYTGGADWKVYQWEAEDLHFCRMYHGHRNNVRCLTTYRDPESGRRYVVSGSDDGTVKVWDASSALTPMKRSIAGGAGSDKDTGCIATLDGQGRGVLSALVLEDTAELWVGSEDTAIRVWDLYSMTITSVITAHRTPVVTLQRVEETIWSGSKDGAVVITNRFSKDVVHQATQPPASVVSSNGAGPKTQQRFNMSIQPVTRTVVYNVWTTSVDGSWQCWNFAAPESATAPSAAERDIEAEMIGYPEGHYLSQSRQRRSSHTSQRRGSSARGAATNDAGAAAASSACPPLSHDNTSAGGDGEDAELRASVARTRRSVAELLTEPAEVRRNGSRSAANADFAATGADGEGTAAAEEDDAAIDAVAESIRNDRAEATKKEVEHQLAALKKEVQRTERLHAELRRLGQDPDAVEAAAVGDESTSSLGQRGATDSPSTQALESVSAKLEAQRAENVALAAAIVAAKS